MGRPHEQDDHEAALAAVEPSHRKHVRGAARPPPGGHVSLLELKQEYAEAAKTFTGLLDPAILDTTTAAPVEAAPVLNNLGVTQLRRGPSADGGSAVYYLTRAADAESRRRRLPVQSRLRLRAGSQLQGGDLLAARSRPPRNVTDADAHYVLAAALQATGSVVEATRERDLARQLSSRYEELDTTRWRGTAPACRPASNACAPTSSGSAPTGPSRPSSTRRSASTATSPPSLERGRRLFEREQDREAMTELRRAVYLSPYEAPAHLLIGRIHLRAGRPDDALEALKILDLERRHGAGPRRARRGLPRREEHRGRPHRARACAGPRSRRGRGAAAARFHQVTPVAARA